jgi:predicted O-methyltransferase YrrM
MAAVHLIGSQLEPTKARRARENLNDAGLADLVEIRIGDALETLKDGIDGDVDLLFLDGAFSLYLPVLKLLEPYLRDGAGWRKSKSLSRQPLMTLARSICF